MGWGGDVAKVAVKSMLMFTVALHPGTVDASVLPPPFVDGSKRHEIMRIQVARRSTEAFVNLM